jgi:hypothetical protein
MADVNRRRRGKPLRPVEFRRPAWSAQLVSLVAHLSFDGRVDRYGCHYYNRSYEQVTHVRRLLEDQLGIVPRIVQRPNGVWVMSYYNVAVADWLAERERELALAIRDRPEWQLRWLKALFDDEGHVHVSGGTRRVRASQHDVQVLETAKALLESLRIQCRIDKGAMAVEITGRRNLETFREVINFSSGLRINEGRKNGLCRQPLEKRAALEQALASYRSPIAL